MVEGNLVLKIPTESVVNPLAPDPLKYTSVSLVEVLRNSTRLEASTFNIEAKAIRHLVEHNPYGVIHLWGDDGLIQDASYPGRFKRIYVEKNKGIPFYLPSQLGDIYPKPTKYISEKTYNSIDGIEIKPSSLLLSRSGTIGKCTISSRTNIGKVYSDDVIRVFFKSPYDLGYVYAFLCTHYGQLILQTNNYGSVVQHIEPDHLKNIILPNAPEFKKKQIHELVIESFELRDQSNELIDEAERILYEELDLPPIEQLEPVYYDKSVSLRNFTTRLCDLNLRADCSYHIPLINCITETIRRNAKEIVTCGNKTITKNIFFPTRFKRTYVEDKQYGTKLIGGKQIGELTPTTEKYLSNILYNTKNDTNLFLQKNTIIVTRSGTVGKVAFVPEHWENWIGSDHLIRMIPSNNNIAGYLYCWLNTDYGQQLIKRNTFGSVVDEIDDNLLTNVAIPILKDDTKQIKINDKILQANDLRYHAYLKEQKAITAVNNILNY